MKKGTLVILLTIIVLSTTGCKKDAFDEYIRTKGFHSIFDTVEKTKKACEHARDKGYSCGYVSYPEYNYYLNYFKDIVKYSEDDGVYLMGSNYLYFPLKDTFYWWTEDNINQVKYDIKTKKCINKDNIKCSDYELEQVVNTYKDKAHYLDDFRGNLKKVVF